MNKPGIRILPVLPALTFLLAADAHALKTKEYRKNGWWQDGPPEVFTGPALYPAKYVAASAPACLDFLNDKPEWRAKADKCAAAGYETVHLYVSVSPDFMKPYRDQIAKADPWLKKSNTSKRVYLLHAECKIVSFMDVAAHVQGNEVYSFNGKAAVYTVQDDRVVIDVPLEQVAQGF